MHSTPERGVANVVKRTAARPSHARMVASRRVQQSPTLDRDERLREADAAHAPVRDLRIDGGNTVVSLRILNPVAQRAGTRSFSAATRVPNLNGKRIGFYLNGKPGGDVVQQRLMERLAARFEGLQFSRFSGSIGGRATLTAEGAQTIAKACDAVIGIRAD